MPSWREASLGGNAQSAALHERTVARTTSGSRVRARTHGTFTSVPVVCTMALEVRADGPYNVVHVAGKVTARRASAPTPSVKLFVCARLVHCKSGLRAQQPGHGLVACRSSVLSFLYRQAAAHRSLRARRTFCCEVRINELGIFQDRAYRARRRPRSKTRNCRTGRLLMQTG